MKMKKRSRSDFHLGQILILFVIAFFLLIPGGATLADSNVPTVTNTPEPTNTSTPQPPTQTSQLPAAIATITSVPVTPTEVDENTGAIAIVTPQPEDSSGGMSTLNRILLVVLGISVVVIVGVIVYIFLNQTRGGLGER